MKKKTSNLLRQLELTGNKYWRISRETGQFLNLMVRDRKPKKVLEIGTGIGYSGIWLAEALKHCNGRLYTIESHKKDRYRQAEKNFQKSGLKNITPILGHAPEDIPKIPKKFDLIFLDATKYEYLNYFHALKNRVSKNGLIIADNTITHRSGLKGYIKTIQNNKNWASMELHIGTGLLISVKIN